MDIQKIDNIEKICKEIDEIMELYSPLSKYLLSIRKQMDLDMIPLSERKIKLAKDEWKKEFKNDIDKCMGINIIWI